MLELERRTMKMQLQSMSSKGFIVIFTGFAFLFLLAVFIGGVGPYVFSYKSLSTWECPADVAAFNPSVCTGVNLANNGSYWVGEIRHMDKLNQRLTFTVTLWNKYFEIEGVERTIPFSVSIRGRRNNDDWRTLTHTEVIYKDITCRSTSQYCDNATLATIPFIDYDTYQFNVTIVNPPDMIENVWFTFTYVHHSFTLFELWFRFIFLIGTFVVLLLFSWNLKAYAWNEWLIEQKWAAVLLFGLIAYNNPFFPIEILVEGWFPVFIDQIFIASFLFLLLLFWLVMIDGIRRYQPSQRSWRKFYAPKFALVGGFWLLVVIVFTWQELSNADDPEAESIFDIGGFVFFYVLFILFVLAYLSWLGYLFVRALSQDNKSLPYLGKRIYFFGFFTIFVIFMVVAGIIFGMIGPVHNNAAELLSYLALMNLYVYVLAIVYLPTQQALEEDDPHKMIGMVRLEGAGSGGSGEYGGGAAYLEAMEASGREDEEDEDEDEDGLDRKTKHGIDNRAAGVGMGGPTTTEHRRDSSDRRSSSDLERQI